MRSHTSLGRRPPRSHANLYALVAALLLFGGTVAFIASCGSEDLVFPGNAPSTPTGSNTATPEP
jgi:hypothetical protein